ARAQTRAARHLVDARSVSRPQDELVGTGVVEVDEARIRPERVGDLLGHEMEHLFEVERRVDRGGRLGEKPQMPLGRVHATNRRGPALGRAPTVVGYAKKKKSAE